MIALPTIRSPHLMRIPPCLLLLRQRQGRWLHHQDPPINLKQKRTGGDTKVVKEGDRTPWHMICAPMMCSSRAMAQHTLASGFPLPKSRRHTLRAGTHTGEVESPLLQLPIEIGWIVWAMKIPVCKYLIINVLACPLPFPHLRSGHQFLQRPSPQKQIPNRHRP